jgi:adenylate cyclase
MPLYPEARHAGRTVVGSARLFLAEQMANLLQRDPDVAAQAVELGIVDPRWLEEPGKHPLSTVAAVDVVQRVLERSVERRPSTLASLGLNTIQLLAWRSEEAEGAEGYTARLAVVFTDLEGFTAFTAQQGDDAASRLLLDHQRAVGPVVRRRGGRLVKHLGDGLLLTFPEPSAAVLAALELLGAAPEPLRLRAGLHVGDVCVTRDDVIGHVVNVAARVAESAKGGEVLTTVDVRDSIAAEGGLPDVTFARARKRSFKGIDERISVCPAKPNGSAGN